MAVSLGPVQDFISAARRTRDLWYGSFILSEISKAVARILSERGELIFPAPFDIQRDLEPGSSMNVANVMLCIINQAQKPEELSEMVTDAAQKFWRQAAHEAWTYFHSFNCPLQLNRDRWLNQIEDVVEVYVVWVPYDLATDEYAKKREKLMRLLSGRKACRDFLPSMETEMRIAKSSLDGRRESVFNGKLDQRLMPPNLRRQLRLTDGEQLDAVGLTKRLGGDRHGCPSVSSISAGPWVRGAAVRVPVRLRDLHEVCKELIPCGLSRADWDQFKSFPFEGSVVYPKRLKSMIRESSVVPNSTDDLENFELLNLTLNEIYDELGHPPPNYVVLAADGDRLGEAISSLRTPEQHRSFSRALAGFAADAENAIKECYGWPVYAGGDDVLAFLPLDTALYCAFALRERFGLRVGDSGIGELSPLPTLSVGLAIVHYLDPLEISLAHAREAEKAAKGIDRDGLAVHYYPGSGAPLLTRGTWKEGYYDRMEHLTMMHKENLFSDKTGFDLSELSRLYKGWPSSDQTHNIIQADVGRLLGRKQGAEALRHEKSISATLATVTNESDVAALANQMIVARIFGRARALSEWIAPVSNMGVTI
jgi:CRISPR-associated protein Cmr2